MLVFRRRVLVYLLYFAKKETQFISVLYDTDLVPSTCPRFSCPRVSVRVLETTHFALPPRLLINIKNSKWLTHFCILLSIIMHLPLFLSSVWPIFCRVIFSHINSLAFSLFFFLWRRAYTLETFASTKLSVSAVHQPFYISICIWTLPTQHTTFTSRSNWQLPLSIITHNYI